MEAQPVIRVNQINKWFGDTQVLKNISFDIQHGQKIVICGPSGSGKSTLIRCLNGLESIQSGEISVLGLSALQPDSLLQIRRQVGMVFQSFNLFPHMTVLDNVCFAPQQLTQESRESIESRAFDELKRMQMHTHSHKYPNQLSGGQQQRVAIARALCMQPKLMLFDEPTSALDPEMISEVLAGMIQLAEEGMTMVVVTHEMSFARKVADEVMFLSQGELVERSSPQAFFDSPVSQRAQQFIEQLKLV